MTLSQLREAVALLGFESSPEEWDGSAAKHFLFCADRALWAVSRLRPRVRVGTLYHDPPQSLLPADAYRHRGGEDLVLEAPEAVSYTFSVLGQGSVTLPGPGGPATVSFSTAVPRRYAGFFYPGTARLVFSGTCDYLLSEVALWDRKTSDEIGDIPPGTAMTEYVLPDLFPAFLRLDDPPFAGAYPAGARLEGGSRLYLPRTRIGTYTLRYRQTHTPLGPDTPPNAVLEADEDLCQLLPLLVAAYMCLETDREKSDFYLRLYADQYARIGAERDPAPAPEWVSDNHW